MRSRDLQQNAGMIFLFIFRPLDILNYYKELIHFFPNNGQKNIITDYYSTISVTVNPRTDFVGFNIIDRLELSQILMPEPSPCKINIFYYRF